MKSVEDKRDTQFQLAKESEVFTVKSSYELTKKDSKVSVHFGLEKGVVN